MYKIQKNLPDDISGVDMDYYSDLLIIQIILFQNDISASLLECQQLWEMYSDSMAAGWMCFPSNEEDLENTILYYANMMMA